MELLIDDMRLVLARDHLTPAALLALRATDRAWFDFLNAPHTVRALLHGHHALTPAVRALVAALPPSHPLLALGTNTQGTTTVGGEPWPVVVDLLVTILGPFLGAGPRWSRAGATLTRFFSSFVYPRDHAVLPPPTATVMRWGLLAVDAAYTARLRLGPPDDAWAVARHGLGASPATVPIAIGRDLADLDHVLATLVEHATPDAHGALDALRPALELLDYWATAPRAHLRPGPTADAPAIWRVPGAADADAADDDQPTLMQLVAVPPLRDLYERSAAAVIKHWVLRGAWAPLSAWLDMPGSDLVLADADVLHVLTHSDEALAQPGAIDFVRTRLPGVPPVLLRTGAALADVFAMMDRLMDRLPASRHAARLVRLSELAALLEPRLDADTPRPQRPAFYRDWAREQSKARAAGAHAVESDSDNGGMDTPDGMGGTTRAPVLPVRPEDS